MVADDFVAMGPAFAYYSSFAWRGNESGGRVNTDFLFHSPFAQLQVLFSDLFGIVIASKVYMLGVLLLVAAFGYLASTFVIKREVARIAASAVFTFNPWVASRLLSGHLPLLIGYSLAPVALVVFYTALHERRLYTLVGGVILGVSFMAVYHSGVLLILMLLVTTIYELLVTAHSKRTIILRFISIILIAGAMNSYWALAFITHGAHQSELFVSQSEVLSLSRNSHLANSIRLFGYWWNPYDRDMYLTNGIFDTFWVLSTFVLPIVVFYGFIATRKTEKRAFWAYVMFVSCLGILLSLGSNLGPVYMGLLQIPFLSVMRDPNKFLIFTASGYALLTGFFVEWGLQRQGRLFRVRYRMLVIFGLIMCLFIGNWVWTTGDFNGQLANANLPNEYLLADQWLRNQTGDFRVLWFPLDYYVSFDWYPKGVNDPLRFLSSVPQFGPLQDPQRSPPFNNFSLLYNLTNLLWGNLTTRAGSILGLATVRYVVLRLDAQPSNVQQRYLQLLQQQTDLQEVWKLGNVVIFENVALMPRLRGVQSFEVILGDLDELSELAYLYESFEGRVFSFPKELTSYGKTENINRVILSINPDDWSQAMARELSDEGANFTILAEGEQFAPASAMDGNFIELDDEYRDLSNGVAVNVTGVAGMSSYIYVPENTTVTLNLRASTPSNQVIRVLFWRFGTDIVARNVTVNTQMSQDLQWHASEPFSIAEGKYTMQIGAQSLFLDLLALSDSASTLTQSSYNVTYLQVNPTLYSYNTSDLPSDAFIVLSENYDPFWRLRDGTGEKPAIPLVFGLLFPNGDCRNAQIIYTLQDSVRYGTLGSFLIIGLVLLLILKDVFPISKSKPLNLQPLRDWFFPKRYWKLSESRQIKRYEAYEQHRERIVINALAKYREFACPERLLVDVGASVGRFSSIASSLGYYVLAIDVDKMAVLYANKHSRCSAILASAAALPLRRGVVSILLSLELMEHLDDLMLGRAIDEYKRVLSVDGCLLASTPNLSSILGLVTSFVGRLTKQQSYRTMDTDHVRYFTSASFAALLKKRGFHIWELLGTYYLPIPHIFPACIDRILHRLRFLDMTRTPTNLLGGLVFAVATLGFCARKDSSKRSLSA